MSSPLGFFERFLTLWVALCIGAGVLFGYLMPAVFRDIASLEYAHVNFVVASLIWVMIYPMMVNVNFSTIKDVGRGRRMVHRGVVLRCKERLIAFD